MYYVSCYLSISIFIFQIGLALAIIAHHVCLTYHTMFAACLHVHMCFAVLAAEVSATMKYSVVFRIEVIKSCHCNSNKSQVCYVIDAYLSPTHLLNIDSDENNYQCIVMGLFLHYFFLTQFTWMMTQVSFELLLKPYLYLIYLFCFYPT